MTPKPPPKRKRAKTAKLQVLKGGGQGGPPRRCTGATRTGKPCGIAPLKGTDRCWRHPAIADTYARHEAGKAGRECWSRDRWLAAYEQTLRVSEACRLTGISRTTAYEARQRDEAFALAWADVDARVVERLEAEMFRRAHDGVTKMVVSAGKVLGEERQFSDQLLMFALKAKRPETYRENHRIEHTGADGGPINTNLIMDPALAREARDLIRRAAATGGD